METNTFNELNHKMVQLLEEFTSSSDHGEESYERLQAAQKALCEAHGWAEEDYFQKLDSELFGFPFPDTDTEIYVGGSYGY